MADEAQATLDTLLTRDQDYNRYSNPGHFSPTATSWLCFDTAGTTARINTVWSLRPATKGDLVVKTVPYLLHWPSADEALCFLHYQYSTLDRPVG